MAVLVVNVPVVSVEIGIVVEVVQPASAPPALAPLLSFALPLQPYNPKIMCRGCIS